MRSLVKGEPPGWPEFAWLAKILAALGSERRLELLHALRAPKALHEIRIMTSPEDSGAPGRPISRQAVAYHLQPLRKFGLVERMGDDADAGRERYVLNHERLFALIDELRSLARLRPLGTPVASMGQTLDKSSSRAGALPPPPRLVVTYGREDGVAYPLHGSAGKTWQIGRSAQCEIRLDYDPYLSGRNTIVERTTDEFMVRDLPNNRNGTWINWIRLPIGGAMKLRPGDVLMVGRTTLVLQTVDG